MLHIHDLDATVVPFVFKRRKYTSYKACLARSTRIYRIRLHSTSIRLKLYAKIATFVVLAAAAVNAQIGIDSCIINCSAAAASAAGCSSYADLPCVCTNMNFQNAANACITATCPSGDLAAAKELQSLECGTLVAKLLGGKSL